MKKQKIKLVKVNENDAEFLFNMMNDKEFQKYFPERLIPKSLEDAKKEIKKFKKLDKKGLTKYFIIKIGKEKVGSIDLFKINKKDKRFCIGYGLKKEYWGKGIATKACKIALSFAKQKLKMHGCEATVHPKNIASKKVLQKLGFKKIGTLKDYFYSNGKFIDRELYWKIL